MIQEPVQEQTIAQVLRLCPMCHNNNEAERPSPLSRPPYHIKECSICSFTYLENPPAQDAFVDTFAWEKTAEAEEQARKKSRPISKRLSGLLHLFRQRVLKRNKLGALIRTYIPHGPILDIGCGEGGVLASLPNDCYRLYGIEISREQAQTAQQRLNLRGGKIIHASATQGLQELDDNFLNGATLSSFLEHEMHPAVLLGQLCRKLKPNGCIILKVPNFACLNRRIRGQSWCGLRFPDHLNYFTPKTLTRLVESKGFSLLQFNRFDHSPISDNMWMVASKKPQQHDLDS